MMKNLRSMSVFLGMTMSLISSSTVLSQVDSSLFVVVDFMKVESTNHSTYLELEQEIWGPMHQERISKHVADDRPARMNNASRPRLP